MKYFVAILLLLSGFFARSQSVYPIRADTVKIYKVGGSSELVLQNATKDSTGILVNVGNGRTAFIKSRKINDSTIVVGLDTLSVGSHGGGSTDTTSISNRINKKLDSLRRKVGSDSVFWYANGTKVFAFRDSVGTGGGSSYDSLTSQGGGFHTQPYNDVRYLKRGDSTTAYVTLKRLSDSAAAIRLADSAVLAGTFTKKTVVGTNIIIDVDTSKLPTDSVYRNFPLRLIHGAKDTLVVDTTGTRASLPTFANLQDSSAALRALANAKISTASQGLTDSAHVALLGGTVYNDRKIDLSPSISQLWIKTRVKTAEDTAKTTQVIIGDTNYVDPHLAFKNVGLLINKTKNNNNGNVDWLGMTTGDAGSTNGIIFKGFTQVNGNTEPQMRVYNRDPVNNNGNPGFATYVYVKNTGVGSNFIYTIQTEDYDSSAANYTLSKVRGRNIFDIDNGNENVIFIDYFYNLKLGPSPFFTLPRARFDIRNNGVTGLGIYQEGALSRNVLESKLNIGVPYTTTDTLNKLTVNGTTKITDTFKLPNIAQKSLDTSNFKLAVVDASGNHFKMNWPVFSGGGGGLTYPNTANKYLNGYGNFPALNTDSITEGSTNLFFTNARARFNGPNYFADSNYALVIFVTGESNGSGEAFNSCATGTETGSRPRVQIGQSDGTVVALNIGANNNMTTLTTVHGLELELANLATNTNRFNNKTIYLVKTGAPGLRANQIVPGQPNYDTITTRVDKMLAYLLAQGKTPVLCELHLQGVNDAINTQNGPAWRALVNTMSINLHTRYKAYGFFPTIFAKIPVTTVTTASADTLNREIDTLVSIKSNFMYSVNVPSGPISNLCTDSILTGGIHFSYPAFKAIMDRMATVMTDTAGYLYMYGSASNALSGSWSTTGNKNTDSSVNYIGTTDRKPLIFKTNGIEMARADSAGKWRFGTGGLGNPTNAIEFTKDIYVNGQFFGAGGGNIASNVRGGFGALNNNSTGTNASAFGYSALGGNSTANFNSAFGCQAGNSTTTGAANTFLGFQAGYFNTTGANNIFLGSQSGTSTTNLSNTFHVSSGGTGAFIFANKSTGQFQINSASTPAYTTGLGFEFLNVSGTPLGYRMSYMSTSTWNGSTKATGGHFMNSDSLGRQAYYDGTTTRYYAVENLAQTFTGVQTFSSPPVLTGLQSNTTTGSVLVHNSDSSAGQIKFTADSYLPAVALITNTAAATADSASYIQMGRIVQGRVSGQANSTTGASYMQFTVTIPTAKPGWASHSDCGSGTWYNLVTGVRVPLAVYFSSSTTISITGIPDTNQGGNYSIIFNYDAR